MKILCTICARKGSKGLKNKNIKDLGGKPLVNHTIDQAINSKIFDYIAVSTDSKIIFNIAKKKGLFCPKLRKKNLSGDKISKIMVIRDLTNQIEKYVKFRFDIICDLDVTSPLRKIKDIKRCINMIDKKCNNVITGNISKKNPYFNMVENKNNKIQLVKKGKVINSRQKAPKVYDMNASIYIWKRDILFSKSPLFNNKTKLYEMPYSRSVDIDDITDFKIVQKLYEK